MLLHWPLLLSLDTNKTTTGTWQCHLICSLAANKISIAVDIAAGINLAFAFQSANSANTAPLGVCRISSD